MKIVQYGNWKIEVDIERTKKYYAKYKTSDTQYNRNFLEYCKNMSDEEKSFFDNFGINPLRCNVVSHGIEKDNTLSCFGFYYVCGKFLEYPKIEWTDEYVDSDSVEANSVHAGIFKFDFQCEDYLVTCIPQDLPKEFICIMFSCQMQWLLKEKCKEKYKVYYPPRFFELHKKLYMMYKRKKYECEAIRESRVEFVKLFNELGIVYETLKKKEINKYKMDWLERFNPSISDIEEVKKICIDNGNFLWHIFSFEIISCYEGYIAKRKFNSIKKKECIIFSSRDNFAYRISNLDKLKAKDIDKLLDVVITDIDFSWTYAKTHEWYLGPYFYKGGN